MSYWHVVEAARRRGEVAIGYRLAAGNGTSGDGVRVNPAKSADISFGTEDRIIVIAED
jgi:ion channel POLLUX/CASTOR